VVKVLIQATIIYQTTINYQNEKIIKTILSLFNKRKSINLNLLDSKLYRFLNVSSEKSLYDVTKFFK
jgi:hypothetical protein